MIYLTQVRLMLESEQTVSNQATNGEEVPRRVCAQLLAEPTRYSVWHSHHENRMVTVAGARRRERQILTLRAFSLEQVHRTALVRYLREYRVVGSAREQTLKEFYGILDPQESAVVEHRNYLLAASSQLCAADLLELVGDQGGLDLMRSYELAYGQFFSMFCEYSRARREGQPYLLTSLIPEVRGTAQRLHRRILAGELLPPVQVVRSQRPIRVKTFPSMAANRPPASTPSAAADATQGRQPQSLLVQAMNLVRVPRANARSEQNESGRR